MSAIKHGTYGGYQRCKRRPDKACADCRRANREYIAGWRQKNPALHGVNATVQMARDRALRRLAVEFPVEFKALYDEELSALPERAPVWGGAA